MKLPAKPHDDLNWRIEGTPEVFEFDLGLSEPYFPLEDELHFQALSAALTHFSKEIWPKFPESKGILYRGSFDFSAFFRWSEQQEANFEIWKKERPEAPEPHLKRLFTAEAFITYFQMLAHRLPDEMPLILIEEKGAGTLAERLHLLSTERFEHFIVETSDRFDGTTGVCFPTDAKCSGEILGKMDRLLERLDAFRPVYEAFLTEQWNGLDQIIVFEETLTPQGRRKLRGFEAAGGKVIGAEGFFLEASCDAARPSEPIRDGLTSLISNPSPEAKQLAASLKEPIGAEGFEPPTYWSQTSRASQTALCPEN